MVDYDKLRGKLAEKRVTQVALAERLGCSRQNVYNKVNGKSPLSLRDVVIICETIEATPETRDAIFFA